MFYELFEKLDNHDIKVITQCMDFILNSGKYDDEENNRIVIDLKDIRIIRNCFQKILTEEIKKTNW